MTLDSAKISEQAMLENYFSDLSRLREVERVWREEFPKHSSGGTVAISGFYYQFLVTLLQAIRSWLNRPTHERQNHSLFIEMMSDFILLSPQEHIIAAQVTMAPSLQKLRSTLNSFRNIDSLISRLDPELSAKVRYRIITPIVPKYDASKLAKDNDMPPQLAAKIDLSTEPDPESELLAKLTNQLNVQDPLGTIYSWIGRLHTATVNGKNARDIILDIWNDLEKHERSTSDLKPPGIYVWTEEDHPPTQIEQGDFLTGEQPTIYHLRRGYFSPRQEVYSDLYETSEKCIARRPRLTV